jgi:hypothetical protein
LKLSMDAGALTNLPFFLLLVDGLIWKSSASCVYIHVKRIYINKLFMNIYEANLLAGASSLHNRLASVYKFAHKIEDVSGRSNQILLGIGLDVALCIHFPPEGVVSVIIAIIAAK